LEEDEEMWFNEDEEEEGKAVVAPVEKSKPEDDFPDSYEKFMETKKGTKILNFYIVPLNRYKIYSILRKVWS
jgi:hypothetical protein